jgi:hypothetical protein
MYVYICAACTVLADNAPSMTVEDGVPLLNPINLSDTQG